MDRHKCLEGPSQRWQRLHGCLGPEGNAASLIACMHPCVKVTIYMRIDFDLRNSSLRGMHALECKGCFFAMRAKRKINFFTTLVCNLCLVPQSDETFALGLRRYMYVTSCTYTHTQPQNDMLTAEKLSTSWHFGNVNEKNWNTACSIIPWLGRVPSFLIASPTTNLFLLMSPQPRENRQYTHWCVNCMHVPCMCFMRASGPSPGSYGRSRTSYA